MTPFFCPLRCDVPLVPSEIVLAEGPLLRCTGCGTLVRQLDEAAFDEAMRRFDDRDRVDQNPRVHIRRLQRLRHHWHRPPEETRVVDVGSSFGPFLDQLRTAGFAASGVEPSAAAAEASQTRGHAVFNGLIEDAGFADASIDVLTLFEVIEHLREPLPLLAEFRRVLMPGGRVFISTGNADSWTARWLNARWDYFAPSHVSFYRPASIFALAAKSGFVVAAIESRRVSFVDRHHHRGLSYALGKLAQELAAPLAKIMNQGHDMLVVLEKPAA